MANPTITVAAPRAAAGTSVHSGRRDRPREQPWRITMRLAVSSKPMNMPVAIWKVMNDWTLQDAADSTVDDMHPTADQTSTAQWPNR